MTSLKNIKPKKTNFKLLFASFFLKLLRNDIFVDVDI
jgi:hypothetical protein